MKKFLEGKKMWGYIIGTICKPMNEKNEKYAEQLDVWKVSNSKIINHLDQQLCWNFNRYIVGKEWNCQGDLGTVGKIISAI